MKDEYSNRLLYLTNRFHIAVCLFSYTSQMTPKCDNKKVAHDPQPSALLSLLTFLPHFDDFCDVYLNSDPRGGLEYKKGRGARRLA